MSINNIVLELLPYGLLSFKFVNWQPALMLQAILRRVVRYLKRGFSKKLGSQQHPFTGTEIGPNLTFGVVALASKD